MKRAKSPLESRSPHDDMSSVSSLVGMECLEYASLTFTRVRELIETVEKDITYSTRI